MSGLVYSEAAQKCKSENHSKRQSLFLDMYCKCYLYAPDSEVHLLTRLCGSAHSPVEEEWFKLLEWEDFWLEAREGPHGLLVVEVQYSQAVQVQSFRLNEGSHDLAGGRIQMVKIGFRLPVFYTHCHRDPPTCSAGTAMTLLVPIFLE